MSKQVWSFSCCLIALAAVGCSKSEPDLVADGGGEDAGLAADSGETGPPDHRTPFDELAAECKGFDVRGLQHSPGGDVLPNKCAPFDNVLNNPYAIRCIDANPSYRSGYPGDEFCILPPPPDRGTQVRVGPTSYTAVPAEFLMQPGREIVDYYYTNATTTEDQYYYRTNIRMRAGSHHMIIRVLGTDRGDGFSPEQDLFGTLRPDSAESRSFGGAQRPDEDRPAGILEVPAENADMGELLKAGQQFSFNLHHFNLGQSPVLREAWVNIWWKPKAEIKRPIGGISIVGNPLDLSMAPGEHRVLHYMCPVSSPVRIITLNGHRHASTSRFGAWVVRKDGSTQSVYESFDYNDMPTYQYDTLSTNPAPDMAKRIDGAWTGPLELVAGDQLHFVCDVRNELAQPLKFANEVKTGEMCILFGSRTGGPLCGLVNRVD